MRELFKDTCWIPYDPYGDGGGGRMCKFCHEREKYPHEKWCKFDKLMGKNHD